MLLYTPAVAAEDFDVAIAYLFRRLEENASEENFIHHLFGLEPGSAAFEAEAAKFRTAVAGRWSVGRAPRRQQDRRREPEPADAAAGFFNEPDTEPERDGAAAGFLNEPDTDPVLASNRAWAREIVSRQWSGPATPLSATTDDVDRVVNAAARAQQGWAARLTRRAPGPAVAGGR